MSDSSATKWVSIVMGIIIAVLSIFGIAQFIRGNQEEARRIEAQNEIARMSEVIREQEGVWSRLSLQKDDIIEDLRTLNSELADTIQSRDEQILTLSTAVARVRDVHVVVRPEHVTETPVESPTGQRMRVDFQEEVDPVRVEGFTLTNPPEAEVTVGFTRPLRLTTVVTQQEDGSWRTYVEGDWPNLEIEQIDSIVNPQPIRSRSFPENIILGAGLLIHPTRFNAGFGQIFLLYDFEDSFAIGPAFGLGVTEELNFSVGLQIQWRPWRQ